MAMEEGERRPDSHARTRFGWKGNSTPMIFVEMLRNGTSSDHYFVQTSGVSAVLERNSVPETV